ncbi:MAG TPA: pyridoxine 5'-phosphate synthase [Alcanivoracaceae bacterium]|nr:pyridoxine 5'-phosphate synthase [Alcanivoracaceae bacterium]
MKRVLLGVNIDHVATLRQARAGVEPEPIQAALLAEEAGADGITVHLRADRRHIVDRDVELLMETIQTRMNLEMAATEEMLTIAERVRPQHICLVPEKPEEITTEGGLDVLGNFEQLKAATTRLKEGGMQVAFFIDAIPEQIEAAVACGAEAIEIHTGHYAKAKNPKEQEEAFRQVRNGLDIGLENGLIVNAGHGLNYHNVHAIAALPGINELNIGHAIVARSVFTGLPEAVARMRKLIDEAVLMS